TALVLDSCSAGGATPTPTVTVTSTATATVTATATATVTASPTKTAASVLSGLQPEACGPLAHGADGTVGPILCKDKHPNALVVGELQDDSPRVMALGPLATQDQIVTAVCGDARNSTIPIEDGALSWQVAFEGWNFGSLDDAFGIISNEC